jgi:hypothetical protein
MTSQLTNSSIIEEETKRDIVLIRKKKEKKEVRRNAQKYAAQYITLNVRSAFNARSQ